MEGISIDIASFVMQMRVAVDVEAGSMARTSWYLAQESSVSSEFCVKGKSLNMLLDILSML